jgi:hypothetical protein
MTGRVLMHVLLQLGADVRITANAQERTLCICIIAKFNTVHAMSKAVDTGQQHHQHICTSFVQSFALPFPLCKGFQRLLCVVVLFLLRQHGGPMSYVAGLDLAWRIPHAKRTIFSIVERIAVVSSPLDPQGCCCWPLA